MKVYIGADHRGFQLKEKINYWLIEGIDHEFKDLGIELPFYTSDVGAKELNLDDDYIEYAQSVGEKTTGDSEARGIVICGSGVGVDVVANKVKGIRCGLGISPEQIRSAREDDDINVLALASDYTTELQAIEMIKTFLKTPFSGQERHKRRLEKIKEYESSES